MPTLKNGQVNKLEDLIVEEVSIVDRPANQRRFLAIKSEHGAPLAEAGGELTVPAAPETPPAPAAAPAATSEDDKGRDEALKALDALSAQIRESVDKAMTISDEDRREIFQGLGRVVGSLRAVLMVADFANSEQDDEPSTLKPVMLDEINNAVKKLRSLATTLGKTKTTKAVEPPPAPAPAPAPAPDPEVERLKGEVERLKKNEIEMVARIRKMRRTVPSSNALSVEPKSSPDSDRVKWSNDMARDVAAE